MPSKKRTATKPKTMQHYPKGFCSEAARAVMEDYYEMLFKRKSFHLFRETDVISKMPSEKFRKDMFKAKRKPVSEIWEGELLPVADIVRFAPSACNTQPWIVVHEGNKLLIYRDEKPGKRGIMPADKVRFYNRIDIGIFLFFLETCLTHEGCPFTGVQYTEDTDDHIERVLVATYTVVS